MKTTTNTIIFLLVVFLVGTTSALTINVSDKGTSFITWDWDNPSNLSEMYIDGALMCGYESTTPSINILDIRAGSCHNITLFSDVGNGTNVTCALWGNTSRGGGESYGNTGATMNNDAIMFGLVGAACGGVVLMGFFLKRRR